MITGFNKNLHRTYWNYNINKNNLLLIETPALLPCFDMAALADSGNRPSQMIFYSTCASKIKRDWAFWSPVYLLDASIEITSIHEVRKRWYVGGQYCQSGLTLLPPTSKKEFVFISYSVFLFFYLNYRSGQVNKYVIHCLII